MTIQITDLSYVDASKIAIDMIVARDDESFPFTFWPTDTAPLASQVRALLDGGNYTIATYVPPPVTKADLDAHVAAARWAKEVAGITVGEVHVETDDRSKLMIIGARKAAEADPQFMTQWKVSTGIFVTLDAATIVAVSDAVAAHVAVCFAKEAEVSAQIAAGTVATFAQIEAAFAAVATAY